MLGRGLKVCSACGGDEIASFSHAYTNREQARAVLVPSPFLYTAKAKVFTKTLALFCSLSENGCSFRTTPEYAKARTEIDESDSESEIETDEPTQLYPHGAFVLVKHGCRSRRKQVNDSENICRGNLVMRRDIYNRYFIVCVFLLQVIKLIATNLNAVASTAHAPIVHILSCGTFKNMTLTIFRHSSVMIYQGFRSMRYWLWRRDMAHELHARILPCHQHKHKCVMRCHLCRFYLY